MRVTCELLRSLGASPGEVRVFSEFLGKRKYVLPTVRNLKMLQQLGLDASWLVLNGLVSRKMALQDPEWAYLYAREVDRGPRDDTRKAACKSPRWAYFYAINVDRGPRDDTRKAACGSPVWAYFYAFGVDRSPHPDTQKAVKEEFEYECKYHKYVLKDKRFKHPCYRNS